MKNITPIFLSVLFGSLNPGRFSKKKIALPA